MTGQAGRPAGDAAEERALRLLQSRGLTLLERNFRCRVGEIDLVMRDGQALVFVEVRFAAAARRYLQQHPAAARGPCRFDVVAITGERVDWLRSAFAPAS